MESLKVILEKESEELAKQIENLNKKQTILVSKLEVIEEIIDIIEGLENEQQKEKAENKKESIPPIPKVKISEGKKQNPKVFQENEPDEEIKYPRLCECEYCK